MNFLQIMAAVIAANLITSAAGFFIGFKFPHLFIGLTKPTKKRAPRAPGAAKVGRPRKPKATPPADPQVDAFKAEGRAQE